MIFSLRIPTLFVAAVTMLAPLCRAHDPLLDVPEPQSVPEAWNVINASLENIQKLFETNQLPIIAFQIANSSPAIRRLQANLPPEANDRRDELQQMFMTGSAIIEATREKDQPRAKAQALFGPYRQKWQQIASHYSNEQLTATVFVCPMHPLDRHLQREARCTICGMALIRRRIPASPIYEKPGAPSMKLIATPDAPLTPGREAKVVARLTKLDGTPVEPDDLLVMHTQRIHLLIIDHSLTDYHHEHPTPTKTPGEYSFSFTPTRPGPYRVWADVVPEESAVQEFVVGDIAGDAESQAITDRATKLKVEVEGLHYELAFDNGGAPLRVGEIVKGKVTVTASDGQPFRELEPIMGSFAHLVGFSEDFKTVVHLHPLGKDPLKPTDRGGPTLEFRFYPPVPGFVRFYSQVNIAGASKFAQFGMTVAPAAATP